MKSSLRAFLFGFLGVAVAVALSFGAFALAGRSIGEPARLRIVSPSDPTVAPSPPDDPTPGPSESKIPPATDSPTATASVSDDHGGHGDEPGEDNGGSNSGPGGGSEDLGDD
jgi:hypothetical protein